MKTSFTKEEIIDIIRAYYKTYLHLDVEVNITSKVCAVDMYDNLGCNTTFEIIRWVSLGSKVKRFTEVLSNEDIKTIFATYFGNFGLEMENLEIDDALVMGQIGYCLSEKTGHVAVFKGINVTIKRTPKLELTR